MPATPAGLVGTSRRSRLGAVLCAFAALAILSVILSAKPKESEAQTEGIPVKYAAGWNLVGAPSATELRGANGPQYSYGSDGTGYVTVAPGEMVAGRAVWAYFGSASTELLGRTAGDYTRIFVPADSYVLVGDPSSTQTLPITGADDAESYDPSQGAYHQVSGLSPGQGAWVLRFMAGFVYVGTPPTDSTGDRAAAVQTELQANPTDRNALNDVAAVGAELVQSRLYDEAQSEMDNFRAAFEDGLRQQGASALQELTARQVQAVQDARTFLAQAQEAVAAGDTGSADKDVTQAMQEGRAAQDDGTALTTGSPTATPLVGPAQLIYEAARTPGTLAAFGTLVHAGFISFALGTPPSDQFWGVAMQTLAGTLPPPRPVAAPTATITIDTLGCTPVTLNVGDSIFCLPVIHGSITNASWTATNANPSTGNGLSFGTSFTSPGNQTISLQACSGSTCAGKSVTVTVGGGQSLSPSPTPTQTAPTAGILNGIINVTEQDVSPCSYSVMPQTSGQIQMSFVPQGGLPGQGAVSGTLQGGGSGSRQVSCNGVTATVIWSVQYQGQFSGSTTDQLGDVTMTGQVVGHQQVTYQNCSSGTGLVSSPTFGTPPSGHGATNSCPPVTQPPAWTYTVHLSGQLQAQTGFGSGSLVMDSGCSTTGTWSVQQH